jgi:predicted RecB family nuclease
MVGRSHDGFYPSMTSYLDAITRPLRVILMDQATKMAQIEHKESRVAITAATFAAYLKCPTKALLSAHGERPSDTFFTDVERDISKAYRRNIRNILSISFCDLTRSSRTEKTVTFVDSETAFYTTGPSAAIEAGDRAKRRMLGDEYVPVLHLAYEKVEQSDRLLVSFCALAIGQATGTEIPPTGKIIFGDAKRVKTVQTIGLLQKTLQVIEAIAKDCRTETPRQVALNKHCPVCDFHARCQDVAINREDLSLLTAMTQKERAKCTEKGITTITQLSYGYRPRRRKRVKKTLSRPTPQLKHDHKLKALAIKKSLIHVVGSPALSIDGTPVFIDVEGVPGRDFFYLIGLRYQKHGKTVERSLWADEPEDELSIWHEFLHALREINNPRLIHYGAYESRFLKLMRERWQAADDDGALIERIVDGSTNLISSIYGKIYFPTYSNSLKDIARWLGFEWTWPRASGSGAILLRRCWELTRDERLRQQLVVYNIEDCRAAELVTGAIERICSNSDDNDQSKLKAVNVSALEVGFQRTFGKFSGALPEFDKINAAAYWDYQRSKVYVRTDKTLRRSIVRATKWARKIVVEKEVVVDDRPERCPRCGSSKIWIAARASGVVFDLKATRRGIKRWAIRYRYNNYRCGACKAQMTPYKVDSKFGSTLRAYVVYLLIEMRLSHERISEHLATVFNVRILGTMVNEIKRKMAQKYEPTYRAILAQLTDGSVVHADETRGVVFGGGHYVWIFANPTSVAYVYSASRDAATVNQVLAGFGGVLVSDFYGGYDSMSCRQQKCLIHLMRDMNEDLLKYPFNEELAFIATGFGTLLRDIVSTIDRYGLKKVHFRKHKRSAERFLASVASLDCSTECGFSLQKRFEKNRDRLFTFLDFDNVPWNNNNAEHAVRAFARLRNGMATSTARGTTDYCKLLTLQQTLRCRGVGFLDFLRLGRTELD